MDPFDQLLEAVKSQMQSSPRALATASTLEQLRGLLPAAVTLADLALGWRMLAQPCQQQEDPATTQRRRTCAELAAIADQLTSKQGNLPGAIEAWQAWRDAFQGSTDPRQAAMAKTFAREAEELQQALP